MKWRHTLAFVATFLLIGGVVYAIAPFKANGIQMPEASDLGKCPAGPQSINCMDNVNETPTWHFQDGGTAVMSGGGGSGGSIAATFRPSAIAAAHTSDITDASGSFTYGDKIVPLVPLTLAGMRFYWPGGHGALTYKVGLYVVGGDFTFVDVSVNAADIYTGTFVSPQALVPGTTYIWTVWETSGSRNIYMSGANLSSATGTAIANFTPLSATTFYPGYYRVASCYSAGDAEPATCATNDQYGLLDPVFE